MDTLCNTKPLFSVLIANHNDGRFLQEAINSVFNQTYSNWEIIIVDDGSTDNSDVIYAQYKSNHSFHIYHNSKNEGCGFTKRRCIEMANGDICGFMDADDALVPEALEKMVAVHMNHPEASLVYSRYILCDNNLRKINEYVYTIPVPPNRPFLEVGVEPTHFVSFKKDYYLKTDGISPYLKCAEDHDLYFKLEEVGTTEYIPDLLYLYRSGTGNNESFKQNGDITLAWDFLAKANACIRQGKNIEQLAMPKIYQLIENVRIAENCKVKETKEYRIGKLLYKPFNYIKYKLSRNN